MTAHLSRRPQNPVSFAVISFEKTPALQPRVIHLLPPTNLKFASFSPLILLWISSALQCPSPGLASRHPDANILARTVHKTPAPLTRYDTSFFMTFRTYALLYTR